MNSFRGEGEVDALKVARENFQYFKCDFFQADAHRLPFKSETFDIIVCSEVLEHLQKDSIALKEMTRALKNNGLVVVTVPYMEKVLGEGHLKKYDLESFSNLCNYANLEIKDVSFSCRTIYLVRYMLRKILKRERMGQKESVLYLQIPYISKLLVSILNPFDKALANKPKFSGFLKFLNEATLITCLVKRKN